MHLEQNIMLSLCLFVRKRTNNHYRKRNKSSENRKKWGFYWVKGPIICGLHDFERNTEKRHFHRGLKNMKVRTFLQKNALESRVFRKNYVLHNFGIYRKWPVRCFWYFARFTHSCCLSGGMTVLMFEITIISSKFSGQIW